MINWNSYETPPLLLRVRKGKKYEVQLDGGKKYKMDKLLFSILLGLLIGLIDIIPMMVQKLPKYSTVSAFIHYFFITIVIIYLDLPQVPWWLQGGIVALALTVPMLIQVGHDDRKPVPIIATNALILGSVVGILAHFTHLT